MKGSKKKKGKKRGLKKSPSFFWRGPQKKIKKGVKRGAWKIFPFKKKEEKRGNGFFKNIRETEVRNEKKSPSKKKGEKSVLKKKKGGGKGGAKKIPLFFLKGSKKKIKKKGDSPFFKIAFFSPLHLNKPKYNTSVLFFMLYGKLTGIWVICTNRFTYNDWHWLFDANWFTQMIKRNISADDT